MRVHTIRLVLATQTVSHLCNTLCVEAHHTTVLPNDVATSRKHNVTSCMSELDVISAF